MSIPLGQAVEIRRGCRCCQNRAIFNVIQARVEQVWRHVMTKYPAACSCVAAVARRFLFAGGAIEARFIAWEAVPGTPAGRGKGRLAGVIRQPPVAAPCTPKETADTVPGLAA